MNGKEPEGILTRILNILTHYEAVEFKGLMGETLLPTVIFLGYQEMMELKRLNYRYGLLNNVTGKLEFDGKPIVQTYKDNHLSVGFDIK